MRPRLILIAVAVAMLGFAPAPFPKPRSPKDADDLSKMQGTWDVIERSRGRSSILTEPTQIKINGTRFDFVVRGEVRSTWEMKLDPARTPRTMDRQGGARGSSTSMPGIYRFEGDKLLLCYSQSGGRRPEGFDDASSMTFLTMTLRRAGR